MELISLVMEKRLGGRKFYELDTAIYRYDGRSESAILDEFGGGRGWGQGGGGDANHILIVQ